MPRKSEKSGGASRADLTVFNNYLARIAGFKPAHTTRKDRPSREPLANKLAKLKEQRKSMTAAQVIRKMRTLREAEQRRTVGRNGGADLRMRFLEVLPRIVATEGWTVYALATHLRVPYHDLADAGLCKPRGPQKHTTE